MIDLFFAFALAVAIVATIGFIALCVYLLIRLFVAAFGAGAMIGLIATTFALTLVIYALLGY